jgi:hypothetical protein
MADDKNGGGNGEARSRSDAYRIGVLVLVILGVLTLGEFAFSAIAVSWWQPLVLIAIIKAAYVIRDYMHVSRVLSPEEEE